jgi:hypothetical protein
MDSTFTLGFLLVWIVTCLLVARVANNKGRSGGAWFILSLFISPLLTLIALLAMPTVDAPGSTKICPRCAETVKLAAQVCKHCGFEFKDAPKQASYNGIPYTTLSNGQVVVTVEGNATTWPSFAAFQQHVDKKRAKLRV